MQRKNTKKTALWPLLQTYSYQITESSLRLEAGSSLSSYPLSKQPPAPFFKAFAESFNSDLLNTIQVTPISIIVFREIKEIL